MNIKEAEALSGVSRRNIRFYEQKGLLSPARNRENDYREYTQDDINTLKCIRALRMVDMSIDQIREVIQGIIPLDEATVVQEKKLILQIKSLQTALSFCRELREVGDIHSVAFDEVLERMDEPDTRCLLPKAWNGDYRSFAREYVYPILMGVIPALVGFLAVGPMILYWVVAARFPVLLPVPSLIFLYLWAKLGYHYAINGSAVKNMLLVHVVPAVACCITVWQYMLPVAMQIEDLRSIGLIAHFPVINLFLALFAKSIDSPAPTILSLFLMLASFGVGTIVAKINMRRVGLFKGRVADGKLP